MSFPIVCVKVANNSGHVSRYNSYDSVPDTKYEILRDELMRILQGYFRFLICFSSLLIKFYTLSRDVVQIFDFERSVLRKFILHVIRLNIENLIRNLLKP